MDEDGAGPDELRRRLDAALAETRALQGRLRDLAAENARLRRQVRRRAALLVAAQIRLSAAGARP